MPFPEWLAGMQMTASRMNARSDRTTHQQADMTVSSTDDMATDINIPIEAGATYRYHLFISYSAVSGTNSAIGATWLTPNDTTMNRFTSSYIAAASTGLNTGALVIMRRPANTTVQVIGGTDSDSPSNYMSAHDRGTIVAGAVSGVARWVVRLTGTGTTNAILRGGSAHTRIVYNRIA